MAQLETQAAEDQVQPEFSKDMKAADRRMRSASARKKRRSVKSVIETKIMNAWAKTRRAKKKQ